MTIYDQTVLGRKAAPNGRHWSETFIPSANACNWRCHCGQRAEGTVRIGWSPERKPVVVPACRDCAETRCGAC